MFSKVEMEFLKSPEKFDGVYRRVLRYRIKVKIVQMREHVMLLQGIGLNVTENCNAVTNFSNANLSLNQALNTKTELKMAGPMGFEPMISGFEGRHLNPC